MKALAFGFFLLLAPSLHAERLVTVLGRIGNELITKAQVEEFMTGALLDDATMADLFKKGGETLRGYEIEKQKWISENIETATKHYVNIRLLQYDAINDPFTQRTLQQVNALEGMGEWFLNWTGLSRWMGSSRNRPEPPRQFFRLTQKQLEILVQENMYDVQRLCFKKNPDEAAIQHCFVQQLITSGFPHDKIETETQIFDRWHKLLKLKVQNNYLVTEARQYMILAARHGFLEYWVRPQEVQEYFEQTIPLLEKELQDKSMDSKAVADYFEKNPERAPAISDLSFLGLDSSTLFKINSVDENLFRNYVRAIQSELVPQYNQALIARIMSYEQSAFDLSLTPMSKSELIDLAKKNWEEWNTTGSYSAQMKSRLYGLASALKESHVSRASVINLIQSEMDLAFSRLGNLLSDESTYLTEPYDKFDLESIVTKFLKAELENRLKQSSLSESSRNYGQAVIEMSVWVSAFEAHKMALNHTGRVHLTYFNPKTKEGYKAVEILLKKRFFSAKVREFQQTSLRPRYLDGRVMIVLNGREVTDHQAFDYLLGHMNENEARSWFFGLKPFPGRE